MDIFSKQKLIAAGGVLLAGALVLLISQCITRPRRKRYRRLRDNVFSPLREELLCAEGSNEKDFAAVLGHVLEENDLPLSRLRRWYAEYEASPEDEPEDPLVDNLQFMPREFALPKSYPKAQSISRFEDITDYVITQYNWCKKKLGEPYEKRQINYQQLDYHDKKERLLLIGDIVLDVALWASIWIGVFLVTKHLLPGVLMITLPISFYIGRTYQRWHQKWGINRFTR